MKGVFNLSLIILPSLQKLSIYIHKTIKQEILFWGRFLEQSQGFKFLNSITGCVHVGVCA